MSKTIKLKEKHIKKIVSNTIKRVLNEMYLPDNYEELPNVIKLYHGTDIYAMDEIVESGVISASKGMQHGETSGVNWFSTKLTGDFGNGTYFSIEVPKSDFENGAFRFMNRGEVVSKNKEISIYKYNMKIEKLDGFDTSIIVDAYNEANGCIWETQDKTVVINSNFQLVVPSYRYVIEQEFGKDSLKEYYDFMAQ